MRLVDDEDPESASDRGRTAVDDAAEADADPEMKYFGDSDDHVFCIKNGGTEKQRGHKELKSDHPVYFIPENPEQRL